MKLSFDSRPLVVPHAQSGRAQLPAPDKQGASIIVDAFESSSSHGYFVEGAASDLGPTGPIHRYSHRQKIEGRDTLPHVQALTAFQVELSGARISGVEALESIERFVGNAASGNLGQAASRLKDVHAEGFTNSVVNFSQGLDALTLLHLAKYPLGPKSKLSAEQQTVYRDNLALALSCEPNASEKTLDNLLLQRITTILTESPQVQGAVEGWRKQVRAFESDRNSVVVAAGNSGKTLSALAHAGFDIDGSEDRNLFSVPEVTTVGALVSDGSNVSMSAVSSFGSEVDFLASGEFQGRLGTSYASPRVANALRAAHVANPSFDSEQAESWLKEQLSYSAVVKGHPVAILDEGRAAQLLRSFIVNG